MAKLAAPFTRVGDGVCFFRRLGLPWGDLGVPSASSGCSSSWRGYSWVSQLTRPVSVGAKQRGGESLEVKEVVLGKALLVRESWRLCCV